MNKPLNYQISVVILVLIIGTALLVRSDADKTSQRYSPQVLIIKFKDDTVLGGQIQKLFQKDVKIVFITNDNYLDELNEKYHLIKVSKVFKGLLSVDEIKEKFPERSKRIPPGAEVPNLRYTYKFEFNDSTMDILKAAKEYAEDPNVDYAHPDYLVTLDDE